MINWGVQPYVVEAPKDTDALYELASKKAVELGFAKKGDKIIVVAGVPVDQKGTTNMMRVQEIK
jgi:pyruvate kinase